MQKYQAVVVSTAQPCHDHREEHWCPPPWRRDDTTGRGSGEEQWAGAASSQPGSEQGDAALPVIPSSGAVKSKWECASASELPMVELGRSMLNDKKICSKWVKGENSV